MRFKRSLLIPLCIALVAASVAPVLSAQASVKVPGVTPPPARGVSRLHISPMPGQVPKTMAELCEKSVVIVQAFTTETLSPRETSPGSLETDAVLSVITVLKGPVVNGQQIVVAQRGGKTSVFSVIPTQYPLLEPGVQYLLFFSEDRRPNSPPITGMKRYLITGIWSGRHMALDSEETDYLRRIYIDLSMDELISQVRTALGQYGASQ